MSTAIAKCGPSASIGAGVLKPAARGLPIGRKSDEAGGTQATGGTSYTALLRGLLKPIGTVASRNGFAGVLAREFAGCAPHLHTAHTFTVRNAQSIVSARHPLQSPKRPQQERLA
jgi:hypothetical protein